MKNEIYKTIKVYFLDYILCKYIKNGKTLAVVLYDRVSSKSQDARKNAEFRKKTISRKCKRCGIKIIAYFYEVASGWSDFLESRVELPKAMQKAIENDAVLLISSLDRLVRTRECRGKFAPLDELDMELFCSYKKSMQASELKSISIVPPDTPYKQIIGELTKWGQEERGKKGGRRKKRKSGELAEIRDKYTQIVMRIKEQKFSLRKISKCILENHNQDISYRTIQDWIKKAGE